MQQAVNWFVRRDAGALSASEAADFDAWLEADAFNRTAYRKVEGLWSSFDGVSMPTAPGLYGVEGGSVRGEPHPESKPPGDPVPHRHRRLLWHGTGAKALTGLAAGLALLLAGLLADVPLRLQADALTLAGETKVLVLPDGSTATLNTASAIAIDYGPDERRIRLLSGEAEFTVAEDESRPFRVQSNSGISQALGTVFVVRRHDDETTVTVLESRVAVGLGAGGGDDPAEQVVLKRDEQVAYTAAYGIGDIRTVDRSVVTAWKRGKLIFAEATLGDVIAELNRYHSGRIIIGSSELRDMRVNGVFETDDPVAVVNALRSSLGLRSSQLSNLLILLHR